MNFSLEHSMGAEMVGVKHVFYRGEELNEFPDALLP